jgi:NAD(P)H dehydrogenase (quinone)
MLNLKLEKMKTKILVTAANGHTGFPAAKELLSLGFKVRAMVRNPKGKGAIELKKLGAEIFIGDMNDVRDYRVALKGIERAYFCSPFGKNTLFQTVAFVSAAEEAQLEHVVYITEWLGTQDHPAMNTKEHWLSKEVIKLHKTVKYTFVNPGLFEFINYFTVETAAQLGLMPTTIKGAANSTKVGLNPFPSDSDTGKVVAHILKDPAKHTGKTYRPTGPKALSPKEISEVFSKIFKRKVKILEVSENMLLKSMKQMGFSMFDMANVKYYIHELEKGAFAVNGVTTVVKDITGKDPEDFETMARKALANMPEAKKSFKNTLKAIRNFIAMLFTQLPKLDKYEAEQEFPQFKNGFNYVQDNKDWSTLHENQLNK